MALVPYLCAGDPNMEVTKRAIQRLDNIQADVIEVGVPYSVCMHPHFCACSSLSGGQE